MYDSCQYLLEKGYSIQALNFTSCHLDISALQMLQRRLRAEPVFHQSLGRQALPNKEAIYQLRKKYKHYNRVLGNHTLTFTDLLACSRYVSKLHGIAVCLA